MPNDTARRRATHTHARRCRPAFILLALVCLYAQAGHVPAQTAAPELFTYAELVQLYQQPNPPPELQRKLDRLLTTPFVNNDATARGVRPRRPSTPQLGAFLRVACWNIERGLEFEHVKVALLGDRAQFARLLDAKEFPPGSAKRARVLQEAALLREADVLVLNELDWGLGRTEYRNVPAELAAALGMNYAYGVEFVEIDPVTLGIEQFEGAEANDRAEMIKQTRVDEARYRGLHGTAILSRYQLDNVRLVPFRFQGHDWYAEEKNGVAKLELGRRKLGEKVFLEKVTREVRRGGRMMLVADISDPDIPTGTATIVATHLEDRAEPKERRAQLQELLAYVKDFAQPVVVAGDMNTSTRDMTPTSIKREIKKRLGSGEFWATQGLKYATGVGLLFDVLKGGVRLGRTQADPTVRSIRFVADNPEAGFFADLKDFRFADGGAFDFRGEPTRATKGRSGALANSNERAQKGFATTFAVERTIGATGRFKLDWFFVKPVGLTDPYAKEQPHRFAPHFGRTLEELNDSHPDRISDHNPLLVDLPFAEPPLR